MDRDTFVRIVQSFADQQCDVDDTKGELTAVIRGDICSVTFLNRGGDLVCRENGVECSPGQWITRRLARLDTLAQRILEYIQPDERLIPVEADFTDTIERNPLDKAATVPDALETLSTAIEDKAAGMTHVIYLTADAGEGKTSLLEALARKQAKRLLEKQSVRLLLPISLGGQALIRLDDILIGTLTNRLRFPFYYIESVLELVKLDLIVLGLDGFEEMFIETQAGGVSSLGTLVGQLGSAGRVICSARTAYYHYSSMDAQARLRECLHGTEVSFSEVHLRRWSKPQFLAFGAKLPLTKIETEKVFDTIDSAMGKNHPLLTRAVLARRFLEEYVQVEDPAGYIAFLKEAKGEQYFEQFVTALLTREANQKWLGRESPARPLLTVEEHHTLLMRIAEEMWSNGVDVLAKETLLLTTEIVAQEELKKPSDIVRQVVERIPQHPFLRPVGGSMMWRFDHEDFRSFYVGRLVGFALANAEKQPGVLRNLLEVGPLPILSVRVGVSKAESLGTPAEWTAHLSGIAEAGSRASHLRENVSRLAVMLLDVTPDDQQRVLQHLLVTGDMARDRTFRNVRFVQCAFEEVDFSESELVQVVFERCEMIEVCLGRRTPLRYDVEMLDTVLPLKLLVKAHDEELREFFDPAEIERQLAQLGFRRPSLPQPARREDEGIKLTFRAIRAFQRATALNDGPLKIRLGGKWHAFETDYLPALLRQGVIMETAYTGGGNQRRFQLRVPFDAAERARVQCGGDFTRFLDLLARTSNH